MLHSYKVEQLSISFDVILHMPKITVILILLVSCAPIPQSRYDGHYYGNLNDGVTNYFSRMKPGCNGHSFMQADVFGNTFQLAVKDYRINGTMDADHNLTGSGTFVEDGETREITFKGAIGGPFEGFLMYGTLYDGQCNPYIELTKPKKR